MTMTGFAAPDGDVAYFFTGGSYVRYDVAADAVDAGYPRWTADHWPGLFPVGIDACLPWHDGTVLFFSGDQYSAYDWAADRVADGYPRSIADDWPGVFSSDLDAAVLLPSKLAPALSKVCSVVPPRVTGRPVVSTSWYRSPWEMGSTTSTTKPCWANKMAVR